MAQSGEFINEYVSELIILCDEASAIRFVSRSFADFFGEPVEAWHGVYFAPGDNMASRGLPARYRTTAMSSMINPLNSLIFFLVMDAK